MQQSIQVIARKIANGFLTSPQSELVAPSSREIGLESSIRLRYVAWQLKLKSQFHGLAIFQERDSHIHLSVLKSVEN
jgi:hypothetical protein